VQGFQSFAVIGNNNTTYYTINRGSEWEVGLGTYYGGTLSRDTIYASSNSGNKVNFSAGAKDVFVTYPAEKSVNKDANNRVLIPYTSGTTNVGSLNVGDATAHTDSGVIAGFTASEPLYLYTSLQNTSASNTSYASYAVNDGGHTAYGELGINNSNYSYSAAGYPNNGFSTPLATFVESYGGPLVLGSWDNQKISMIINGAVSTTDAMTINTDGSVAFNGQVGTAGQILQSNATSAPTWVTPSVGTVTSVGGTGTVNGLSLSGTVTSSGNLTFGGTLDLSSPPAIGSTAANTGRFTTVTSTVATGTAPFTVTSTTPVTNLSIGGNSATVTNGVYTTDTGTVTNTMLAGSIANAKLTNSSITFGSTAQALGSTVSAISGVTIDNGAIGGTTAAAGTFTTLSGTTSTTTPIVQNSAAAAIAFKTNSATSAVTQFNVAHTATAVNYVQVTGAATGANPKISAQGSDLTVGFDFQTKGAKAYNFFTSTNNLQLEIAHVASVNWLQVKGSAAGAAPVISSQGTDADIDLTLTPKGAGNVRFGTYTASALLAVAGYITIKDSGGTTRRLLVG
jgi:hypothetical protein